MLGRPCGYYQLTHPNKQALTIAMLTQANALERANANAGKEYSVRNVDNNQIWDNTGISSIIV